MNVVGRKGLMFVDEAWSDFLHHTMIAIASTTNARPARGKCHGQGLVFANWPNLAHSINHAFGSVRHWLIPFR